MCVGNGGWRGSGPGAQWNYGKCWVEGGDVRGGDGSSVSSFR